MSQLSSTGLHDDESECANSGGTQDTECSPSSTTLVSSTMKTEKSLEGSTSLETAAWTDSKHSSYLDFMEASFVQNMFARNYCMADVCGGTAQHHHHHHHHRHHYHHDHEQHDSVTNLEESNYDSAESQLQSHEALQCEMYDNGDWTWKLAMKRAKASTGIPWVLLENPWVKHFRPRHSSSASSKTRTLPTRTAEIAKRDVQRTREETASTVVNSNDHHQQTSDSMSDSEKVKKRFTPDSGRIIHLKATSSGRIIHLKAGEMKASILNTSSNGMLDRNSSRNKRRVLWSFYKEVHRIRQKTGNYVQGGNIFNQDGAAPPNLIL